MGAIKSVESSIDHTWGTPASGTWIDLGDFLADGLEPGIEEIITTEMGDNADEQDGIKASAAFKVASAGALAAGTRTWFRFKEHDGTGHRLGGTVGCRIALGKAGVRPLGGGPPYTEVKATATGSVAGDMISTTLA